MILDRDSDYFRPELSGAQLHFNIHERSYAPVQVVDNEAELELQGAPPAGPCCRACAPHTLPTYSSFSK